MIVDKIESLSTSDVTIKYLLEQTLNLIELQQNSGYNNFALYQRAERYIDMIEKDLMSVSVIPKEKLNES
jgi:hypothetical protein